MNIHVFYYMLNPVYLDAGSDALDAFNQMLASNELLDFFNIYDGCAFE